MFLSPRPPTWGKMIFFKYILVRLKYHLIRYSWEPGWATGGGVSKQNWAVQPKKEALKKMAF